MNKKFVKLSIFYTKFLTLLTLCIAPYFVNASPILASNKDLNSLLLEPYYLTKELAQPLYIDFGKMEPVNTLELIKEKYLTFYSSKNEKLRATYLHGAYAINYVQRW